MFGVVLGRLSTCKKLLTCLALDLISEGSVSWSPQELLLLMPRTTTLLPRVTDREPKRLRRGCPR